MNTPWATGWANWDEQANLRDITSLGMLGWLQIAVARISALPNQSYGTQVQTFAPK